MADDARCEEIRAERARLQIESDSMPARLEPQPGDPGVGPGNAELRGIYDRINDLRKELLELGCEP